MALGAARAGTIGSGGATRTTLYILGNTQSADAPVRTVDGFTGQVLANPLGAAEGQRLDLFPDGSTLTTNNEVSSGQQGVRIFDRAGALLATMGTVSAGYAAPLALPGGDVIVGLSSPPSSGDRAIQRFARAGGAPSWSTPTPLGFIASGSALHPSGDPIVASPGRIMRLDADDGSVVWSVAVPNLQSDAFIATDRDGYVYVPRSSSPQAWLEKRSGDNGATIDWTWSRSEGGPIAGIAVDRDRNVYLAQGIQVRKLNVDGDPVWTWAHPQSWLMLGVKVDKRAHVFAQIRSEASTAADHGIQALDRHGVAEWFRALVGSPQAGRDAFVASPGRHQIARVVGIPPGPPPPDPGDVPAGALLAEDGGYLTTEDGRVLVIEGA